ncbi:MAG: nucleoside-triphosphatase [Bacteroidales bacterium]
MKKNELNNKWIKASIIGTLWAASEIVLGSFLHNLKIPFSGNILTAIGLIILISVSYIWTEKGLFWRAGIICAIMKTMSPSAVIFGPMIAIFIESVLLETSVRLLGKIIPGYLLGSMLAMSWNLFQKIANYIIFYGFNIVDLYTNLVKFAQKQLNIHFDIVWLPPLVLLILYCVFGLISALIGIRIGRKILKQPSVERKMSFPKSFVQSKSEVKPEFSYSLIWLFTDIFLIIGSLVLLNYAPWVYWSSAIIAIVGLWAFRYKRALRQLSKPKFWIIFVLITMLTAFVFTKVMTGGNSLMQGLLSGIQMNFRAVIIIVGFSVLGTELYNPKIRSFFLKTSFKQLPLALELSFESLPSMISNIPEFKTIVKNPVSVFYQIISQVDYRLAEVKRKIIFKQKVFIITGSTGQGKTTMVQNIIDVFKQNKISVGGFYSPKVIEDNKIIGYDIVDISTNSREIFLRLSNDDSLAKIGKFSIFPRGLQTGTRILKSSANVDNEFVIIDEAGSLELENKGWAAGIRDLTEASNNHIILVVRDIFVERILKKWNIEPGFVYNVGEMDYLQVSDRIIKDTR